MYIGTLAREKNGSYCAGAETIIAVDLHNGVHVKGFKLS